MIRPHIWTGRLQEPGEVQEQTAEPKPLGSTFIAVVLTATRRLNKPLHFSTILHPDVWILKVLWLVYRFVWRIWVRCLAHEMFVANVWSVCVCVCMSRLSSSTCSRFCACTSEWCSRWNVCRGQEKDLTLLEVNSQMSWIPGKAQALCLVPQILFQPLFNARDKATPWGVSPTLIKMGSFVVWVSLKCVR